MEYKVFHILICSHPQFSGNKGASEAHPGKTPVAISTFTKADNE